MLVIRDYLTSDQTVLEPIYLHSRQKVFSWVPADQFKTEDFLKDTEGELILVAELDSVVIGFISIWMQDNFIHNLFLDPKYQGKSYGGVLLAEGLKMMGRPARLKCAVQNVGACSFYEKNGWVIESTSDQGPTGPYHNYLLT